MGATTNTAQSAAAYLLEQDRRIAALENQVEELRLMLKAMAAPKTSRELTIKQAAAMVGCSYNTFVKHHSPKIRFRDGGNPFVLEGDL